ncbi:glycosyl hydrolase family 47-domain-containing protein [Immersiella caudata]|uniref:alpha-1,2-Mannosidase n=1 Tax=Immersiella caudata TaxID=314043 RepID=A0AA39TL96_9PEZI|nr:glycosyl hydrolase family 47-domain-containing protein [Immersiella caudata]
MPRLRRYRVFLIFAFIVIALLYHVSKNTQWERFQMTEHSATGSHSHHNTKPETGHDGHNHGTGPDHQVDKSRPAPPRPNQPPPEQQQHHTTTAPASAETSIKIPKLKSGDEAHKGAYGLPTTAPTKSRKPKPLVDGAYETPSVPAKKPGTGTGHHDSFPKPKKEEPEGETFYADWPPKLTDPVSDPNTTPTAIHWRKPYEYYPIPEEKMIMLPTGKPKPIPKVQFEFAPETPAAKEKREARLIKIKAEAKKAWTGYRTYAWGHDEVRPISKGPHDPFCGWAATLVDALDTLWIMGLKREFEEGVKAAKAIDFTTTPYRNDIPVFETIIRYLGGLVGAYDVSGGKEGGYTVLLDKAEELAEILMGVFDTPNRMPILYYQWRPQDNEVPKRASASSGVAELGSMGMEFTRLAQLTGKNKYYDAIARITDALEELQNREGGTAIPGVFPQNLDASGCNQTAAAEKRREREEEARAREEEERRREEETRRKEEDEEGKKRGAPTHHHREGETLETDSNGDGKDDLAFEVHRETGSAAHGGLAKRFSMGEFRPSPPGMMDDECIPQPLKSPGYGSDSYSMGGSQDSAYEYFPKQYVLLGGLVPKYRTMHLKTVEGVKNYLLFRPQAKGDPDVLFSAKAFSPDGTDKALTYEYEVTHLTCFLGGMFGLGGKIFNKPEDVEIGKRLAAGCAWAYEAMPTGIMPEYAQILPCDSAAECHFNETQWGLKVDPYMTDRERQAEEYEKNMAKWREDVADAKRKKAQAEAEEKRRAEEEKRLQEEESRRPVNATTPDEGQMQTSSSHAGHDLKEKDSVPAGTHLERRGVVRGDAPDEYRGAAKTAEEKAKKVEGALDFNSSPSQPPRIEVWQRPLGQTFLPPEPVKPLTHEEYMASQKLYPGFTTITDRRYILRPEAIESVWYMYRITGDPIWQDRGWSMWQAVIRATQTEIGHSAISDVTTNEKHPTETDSMESFWLAETLKYFYLLFAEPDVISLDEWVLNTEAHPFRRPV